MLMQSSSTKPLGLDKSEGKKCQRRCNWPKGSRDES